MDIFEKIRQLDLLCEIASKAAGMDKHAFIAIAIVKGICREARDRNREDGIARAERESMEVKAKQIPATKSSIDALGREVFNDSGSATDCIVCMEEIEAGDVAIRMPFATCVHFAAIICPVSSDEYYSFSLSAEFLGYLVE
ncbi:unnamed protein product [Dovyalis caffra]|uniref:RING-type domain-containing protein n=1 Tax=Dovyalis caffra TaxID=77055 RepID=A0AAV1SNJ7_9ROSI|nr:unnamed protein product [Dovyalis caffra]